MQIDGNKTLTVDDAEYKLTPGLEALIMLKHPRPTQFNNNDYKAYKSLDAQTRVKSFPNKALLNHTLRGNGSICLGNWLYLRKG